MKKLLLATTALGTLMAGTAHAPKMLKWAFCMGFTGRLESLTVPRQVAAGCRNGDGKRSPNRASS
ncbi:MAG: hypothetical protein U5N10_19385 [Gemmobacter sp.]|nr:hypothetical protein [Gemmobacter sp.]